MAGLDPAIQSNAPCTPTLDARVKPAHEGHMVSIGEFRHRLLLQVADEIEDGAGGVTRTFEPLGEVWAAIKPLSADDAVYADKRLGALTHRIVLRHRADLTLSHRFALGERVFEIRAVRDPDERGRVIECLVEERKP